VKYDVVIVGGGPAGSLSAALLAAQGRHVLLVDAARFPRPKACAELISPGGVAILERLGVLSKLTSGRRLRGMQVHSPGGYCHTLEYPHRALSIERRDLDHTLLEFARSSGAQVREHFPVRGILKTDGCVSGVIGPHTEAIKADLTVGADGLHSVVARDLHLRRPHFWPRRLGLTAHFTDVDWSEDVGEMLVSGAGYVGVAPLDDSGRLSLGLVQPLPRGRLGPSSGALDRTLRDVYPDLHRRLSRGHLDGHVAGIGPMATRVHPTAGAGYALVGDAAGFIDPFTGEGIFRALRGAELLAEDVHTYAARRRGVFGAKERLVYAVQVVLRTPRLVDVAVRRLNERPSVAARLAAMLGDLEKARLQIIWELFRP